MKCERCGRNVPIRSKVCPNCGKDNPAYNPNPTTEPIFETPTGQPVKTGGATATQAPKTQAQAAADKGNRQTTTPAEDKPATPQKKSTLKTLVILAIIVIGVIFIMKQCKAYQLRGTWVATDGSSITFSDSKNGYVGTGRSSRERINFTYFVDGDELEIKTKDSAYGYSKVVRYKFKVSGSKLTLTDQDYGTTEVFYKK